jgi:putative tryptophan/tyrosine transport system substrate-binding protein
MRRRKFVTLLGCAAAAWPFAVRAQRAGKVWRIAFLSGASAEFKNVGLRGFPDGMRELGYVEDQDFTIDWRFADGNYDRFKQFARELLDAHVDIFVLGSQSAARPIEELSKTVPIVLGYSIDPVGNGLAASLAHPGGQVTGLAGSTNDPVAKQIELLGLIIPKLSRLGILQNPRSPFADAIWRETKTAAERKRIALVKMDASNPGQVEDAFQTFVEENVQALKVDPDALFMADRQRIATLALYHGLPTIFSQSEYVEAGGLMSYGESLREFFRRSASYVDKIIKGAKPGDLAIEQPTALKLVINRITADALELRLPPRLYALTDWVVE